MNRSAILIALVVVSVYAAFWIWYGGRGEPLTSAEVDRFVATVTENAKANGQEPDDHLLDAFRTLAAHDDGREFYMLNLMRYREKARYPEGSGYGDDVQAAASRYNAAVLPALIRRGSLPILVGDWQGTFLQPEDTDVWDQVGIVRYRSRRDMLSMAVALSKGGGGEHKWASIEKTHVFPIAPVFDFVFVRGAVAALLILLGLLSYGLVRLRTRRRPTSTLSRNVPRPRRAA